MLDDPSIIKYKQGMIGGFHLFSLVDWLSLVSAFTIFWDHKMGDMVSYWYTDQWVMRPIRRDYEMCWGKKKTVRCEPQVGWWSTWGIVCMFALRWMTGQMSALVQVPIPFHILLWVELKGSSFFLLSMVQLVRNGRFCNHNIWLQMHFCIYVQSVVLLSFTLY